jgi:hypothetical protein
MEAAKKVMPQLPQETRSANLINQNQVNQNERLMYFDSESNKTIAPELTAREALAHVERLMGTPFTPQKSEVDPVLDFANFHSEIYPQQVTILTTPTEKHEIARTACLKYLKHAHADGVTATKACLEPIEQAGEKSFLVKVYLTNLQSKDNSTDEERLITQFTTADPDILETLYKKEPWVEGNKPYRLAKIALFSALKNLELNSERFLICPVGRLFAFGLDEFNGMISRARAMSRLHCLFCLDTMQKKLFLYMVGCADIILKYKGNPTQFIDNNQHVQALLSKIKEDCTSATLPMSHDHTNRICEPEKYAKKIVKNPDDTYSVTLNSRSEKLTLFPLPTNEADQPSLLEIKFAPLLVELPSQEAETTTVSKSELQKMMEYLNSMLYKTYQALLEKQQALG